MSDFELMNYGFRIFWAVLLGAVLAGGFRGSWNVENENGKRGFLLRERSDTVVWLDPLAFPILCAVYLGINLIILFSDGGGDKALILNVIDMFLFISVYFTLLLLILPLLRKYYTAKTCTTLWLIPVFLF